MTKHGLNTHGTHWTYQQGCRCEPCRTSVNAWQREYYQKHSERLNFAKRLRKHGLSEERYLTVLVLQDSACPICEEDFSSTKKPVIDHDHACCPSKDKSCGGCFRGLICASCNLGLGYFRDNPLALSRATKYVAKMEA